MLKGQLSKLKTQHLADNLAQYTLVLGDEQLQLNNYLGKQLTLEHSGKISCFNCQKTIKKSYSQGYCYPCTLKLASCDMCILKPELCHYAKGSCREPNWGLTHCMIPHVVYLANSSDVKVGITRATQIPHRWIDQGASFALPLYKTPSRHLAGLIEVQIAKSMSDKTNWRNMLKNEIKDINLYEYKENLFNKLSSKIGEWNSYSQSHFDIPSLKQEVITELADSHLTTIEYPVLEYPTKITSLNLDKTPKIEGTLLGIKGQYLILDTGVINLRKYGGYEVSFNVS